MSLKAIVILVLGIITAIGGIVLMISEAMYQDLPDRYTRNDPYNQPVFSTIMSILFLMGGIFLIVVACRI